MPLVSSVYVSVAPADLTRIAPLLRSLDTWGISHNTPQPGSGVESLSNEAQRAIADSQAFLRVCTRHTVSSYWMSLESGSFLGLQSEEHRQGTNTRRQINLVLDPEYVVQPFDRAGSFINAITQPTLSWVNTLRASLGLPPLADVSPLGLDITLKRPLISRRALVTSAIGGAVAVVGVGSAAAVYVAARNNALTVLNRVPTPTPKIAANAHKWATQVGGPIVAEMALSDGTLYAAASSVSLPLPDGKISHAAVYALEAGTGAITRTFLLPAETPGDISANPTVGNGALYQVASAPEGAKIDQAILAAYRLADGQTLWVESDKFLGSLYAPLLSGSKLYISGYGDGLVSALDAATSNELTSSLSSDLGTCTPVLANGFLYVVSVFGTLYALDPQTLAIRWQTSLYNQLTSGSAISGSLTVAGNVAYVGVRDGNLWAVDALAGRKLWHYQTGGQISYSIPAVAAGTVFVGSRDGSLYAVDAATGTKKWAIPTNGAIITSPAVANGVVYFGSGDQYLYAVRTRDGTVVTKYPTGGLLYSSPIVSGDTVFIASQDHTVYAFPLATA